MSKCRNIIFATELRRQPYSRNQGFIISEYMNLRKTPNAITLTKIKKITPQKVTLPCMEIKFGAALQKKYFCSLTLLFSLLCAIFYPMKIIKLPKCEDLFISQVSQIFATEPEYHIFSFNGTVVSFENFTHLRAIIASASSLIFSPSPSRTITSKQLS